MYFGYAISNASSKCNNTAKQDVYTFVAHGDLDGDNINSTFELATQVDADMTLYHARGFYIANEVE